MQRLDRFPAEARPPAQRRFAGDAVQTPPDGGPGRRSESRTRGLSATREGALPGPFPGHLRVGLSTPRGSGPQGGHPARPRAGHPARRCPGETPGPYTGRVSGRMSRRVDPRYVIYVTHFGRCAGPPAPAPRRLQGRPAAREFGPRRLRVFEIRPGFRPGEPSSGRRCGPRRLGYPCPGRAQWPGTAGRVVPPAKSESPTRISAPGPRSWLRGRVARNGAGRREAGGDGGAAARNRGCSERWGPAAVGLPRGIRSRRGDPQSLLKNLKNKARKRARPSAPGCPRPCARTWHREVWRHKGRRSPLRRMSISEIAEVSEISRGAAAHAHTCPAPPASAPSFLSPVESRFSAPALAGLWACRRACRCGPGTSSLAEGRRVGAQLRRSRGPKEHFAIYTDHKLLAASSRAGRQHRR